jgi:hypothetical protein
MNNFWKWSLEEYQKTGIYGFDKILLALTFILAIFIIIILLFGGLLSIITLARVLL